MQNAILSDFIYVISVALRANLIMELTSSASRIMIKRTGEVGREAAGTFMDPSSLFILAAY